MLTRLTVKKFYLSLGELLQMKLVIKGKLQKSVIPIFFISLKFIIIKITVLGL